MLLSCGERIHSVSAKAAASAPARLIPLLDLNLLTLLRFSSLCSAISCFYWYPAVCSSIHHKDARPAEMCCVSVCQVNQGKIRIRKFAALNVENTSNSAASRIHDTMLS